MTSPTDTQPAIVRPAVLEKLNECRALSANVKTRNRQTAADIIRLGKLLTEIKEEVGHGRWQAFLNKHWPDIDPRTARFWMNRFKTAIAAQIGDAMDEATHAGIDDDDEGCGEDEENRPPADEHAITANAGQNDPPDAAGPPPPAPMSKERRNRLFCLKITLPKLANRVLDRKAELDDAELRKLTAWACPKCVQLGPPARPCDTCTANRKARQRDLLQQQSEPADPDDPASPPEPPRDPLAELRKQIIKTQAMATAALNSEAEECVRLRDFLTACRVVDYQDGTPRFRALTGVAKVIELAGKDDVDVNEARHQYGIASGEFVPPAFERRRKKGKQ